MSNCNECCIKNECTRPDAVDYRAKELIDEVYVVREKFTDKDDTSLIISLSHEEPSIVEIKIAKVGKEVMTFRADKELITEINETLYFEVVDEVDYSDDDE